MTDSSHDRQSDIETNNISINNIYDKHTSRKKREAFENVGLSKDNANGTQKITSRNDDVIEYEEAKLLEDEDFVEQEDVERGKRQIRYYTPKGYKNPSKHSGKPIRFVDFQQFNYNPNIQSSKYQPQYNGLSTNYHDGTRKPYSIENNFYSTANPFAQYQQDSNQSQKPFKASLPDPFSQRLPHAPMNVATQIITKAPPISALQDNENPFSSLAGGFFNNLKKLGNNQFNQNSNHYLQFSSTSRPNDQVPLKDSSLLPSTVVTGKPIKMQTPSQVRPKYRIHSSQNANVPREQVHIQKQEERREENRLNKNQDYDDDDEDEEDEESDEDSDKKDEDDGFKHDFPAPPYEFTHHKFTEVENPFADPNFDFDAFLAKLRGDSYAMEHDENETPKSSPKPHQNIAVKIINAPTENTTPLAPHSNIRSSTINHYHGMSTPRPFSVPTGPEGVTVLEQNDHSSKSTTEHSQKFEKLIEVPHPTQQNYVRNQHHPVNDNIYIRPQNAGIPLEVVRPKLKPPNFKDDRQLPITYNFQQSVSSTFKPNGNKLKGETQQFTITQKPFVFITSTGSPIAISSPKQQFLIKPEKYLTLQPHLISSAKPYLFSTMKPHNAFLAFKQSTSKPLTTLANEQLAALQYYWKNPTTEFYINSSPRPQTFADIPKLEKLFAQAIKSAAKTPTRNQNYPSTVKDSITTTTKPTTKRRPIPKPSPEMNDYYYDDEDDQYYYEPPVKSKYMPSTEIKPQRPPMAQNYQEYEDYEDSEESPGNNKPLHGRPAKYNSQKPDTATKNHNDVSVVTKSPLKDNNKYINGKIPVPVIIGYSTPASNVLMRPVISNYQLLHPSRNRTMHFRKPMYPDNGPYTAKPPKYLNQTTLRPYTVRHRLAKPTTVKDLTTITDEKQIRGRIRHHNLVAMKLTTPRDNHNQETRFTKTKHDDKTNR